jgi:hypothetical protein
MRVYGANFGRDNWAWQSCQDRKTIALTEDIDLYPYLERRDRNGFIREARRLFQLRGSQPASRWYNEHEEFRKTANDYWIHQDARQGELWWTESSNAPPTDEIIDDPRPRPQFAERRIHIFHKPCSAWSNRNRSSVLLKWNRLHPRARKFLSNKPGAIWTLSPDNAAYAQALISGDPLSSWHDRADWEADARREPRWRGPI